MISVVYEEARVEHVKKVEKEWMSSSLHYDAG
jgi:hypothetical protein